MSRYTVPVIITVNAMDAEQAYKRVAFSSINDLEIPGLAGVSVGDPVRAAGKVQPPALDPSQIRNFPARAAAELSTWDSEDEISTDNTIALADLVREAREILSQLKP